MGALNVLLVVFLITGRVRFGFREGFAVSETVVGFDGTVVLTVIGEQVELAEGVLSSVNCEVSQRTSIY